VKTFLLNENGELEFDGRKNIRVVSGPDEKLQSVRLLLTTAMGEWFLNTQHGLDHWAFLGERWPAVEEETRAAFMEAFEQEPRIAEVFSLAFELLPEERKLKVRFRLRMDGEEVDDEAEVGI